MKRKSVFWVIVVLVIMALVLVGCSGKKETSSGNNVAQPTNISTTDGGLFNIADSEIKIDGGDLSALPDYLKKGIGSGRLGYITLRSSDFLVQSYDVKKEQLHDLRDYYAENCGMVKKVNDDFIDDMGMFEIIFEWGQINAVFSADNTGSVSVTAMFY